MKVPTECALCQQVVEYGPPDYAGKRIPQYRMFLCATCFAQAEDGILKNHEERFEAHLESEGIPLPQKENGLYPRGL